MAVLRLLKLCLLGHWQKHAYSFFVLVDTDNDVTEAVNVINESYYADTVDLLEERYEYFKSVDVVKDPEDFTGAQPIWAEAGCIIPLSGEYSEDEIPDIEVGTPREDAPNIVFILLDDVGLNDMSFGGTDSTWIDFATPNLAALAADGITLENHYSCWVCGPTRSALLTGKYPYRNGYGMTPTNGEVNLPLNQTTLAEQLKPLGYRTALIGKWHLGVRTWAHSPMYRGFDSFYGYYFGAIGYYDKFAESGHLDLQDNEVCVSNEAELDESLHLTTLLQIKAEAVIADHALNYPDLRLFLYYAMENMHTGPFVEFEAPEEYVAMCANGTDGSALGGPSSLYYRTYCALVVMMDEAIGNTVCALEAAGLAENTLVVVTSDNGGYRGIAGTSYPYKGVKGSFWAGGTKTRGLVYGPPSLIPEAARGSVYYGLMHVSDWYVTLLKLADPAWSSSEVVDGVDNFKAMVTNSSSNRTEMFMNFNNASQTGAMQIGSVRYIQTRTRGRVVEAATVLEAGETFTSAVECSDFQFADDDMAVVAGPEEEEEEEELTEDATGGQGLDDDDSGYEDDDEESGEADDNDESEEDAENGDDALNDDGDDDDDDGDDGDDDDAATGADDDGSIRNGRDRNGRGNGDRQLELLG